MPQSSATSSTTIKRNLQKNIRHLVEVLPQLQDCEKQSEKTVKSLANVVEQRECANQAQKINGLLLKRFPDLRERLHSKLSDDVSRKVVVLFEHIALLKNLKDFLGQYKEDLWQLLANLAKGSEYDALLAGSPTTPGLEMMLAWIDLAEVQARQLYCAREFYLNDIAEQTVVKANNLVDLWKEDSHLLLETLSDCEAHVKYFLEEKI